MPTSWWDTNYNGVVPVQFLHENWRTMTDNQIADELSQIAGRRVTRDAVKSKRRSLGINKSENSLPPPAERQDPVRFHYTTTNTAVVESHTEGAVKTLDQLLKEGEVDLDVWRVDRWILNKWPVGAKAERKSLRWADGKIQDGFVESDGLTIAQLWQVKAWLVRKNPKPVLPVVQPVDCAFEFVAPPKPTGGVKRSVVWTDPQIGFKRDAVTGELIPLHDDRALDVILQIAIAAKADRVDMLGDIFDLSDMSAHFLQEPEFRDCLQPAIIVGHYWFSQFRQALPEAYIAAHEGNHDLRMQTALGQHLRAAYELRPADELDLPPALSVPRLLALHKLGIRWIGGYPRDEDWLSNVDDGVRLSHGNVARAPGATARAVVEQAETSEIVGHAHRVESASKTLHRRRSIKVIRAHCVGCTCHVDGRVPSRGEREQWQQSLAVVDYDSEGTEYSVTDVLIQDGRAVWNGQLFEARDVEILP